jgi:hypothetical protein
MTRPRTLAAAALLSAALGTGPAPAGEGKGTFTGQSGHETSGTVEVGRTGAGWEVRLGEDFRFDGAPDPRVGFGSGGSFAPGTDFAPLASNSGAQTYTVPEGIDPAGHGEVYIWCGKFAVPLGVATIAE